MVNFMCMNFTSMKANRKRGMKGRSWWVKHNTVGVRHEDEQIC